MKSQLPIYLHTLRKIWALTQEDLAFLMGVPERELLEIEAGRRQPTIGVMIGAEIVFGDSYRAVFPAFYEAMESEIMGRAATLDERLEHRRDRKAAQTRRLLKNMIARVEPHDTDI